MRQFIPPRCTHESIVEGSCHTLSIGTSTQHLMLNYFTHLELHWSGSGRFKTNMPDRVYLQWRGAARICKIWSEERMRANLIWLKLTSSIIWKQSQPCPKDSIRICLTPAIKLRVWLEIIHFLPQNNWDMGIRLQFHRRIMLWKFDRVGLSWSVDVGEGRGGPYVLIKIIPIDFKERIFHGTHVFRP